jgi:hypothetical protein
MPLRIGSFCKDAALSLFITLDPQFFCGGRPIQGAERARWAPNSNNFAQLEL